jgi:hypothetical protein
MDFFLLRNHDGFLLDSVVEGGEGKPAPGK